MQEINYHSIAALTQGARDSGEAISTLVLREQATQLEQTQEEVYQRMARQYQVMADCIEPGTQPDLRSTSGLTGGDAYKMKAAVDRGTTLCGPFLAMALSRALAVSELNAGMGRVVAAPTAGSCGILPAALLTLEDSGLATRDQCIMGIAAAVGMGESPLPWAWHWALN